MTEDEVWKTLERVVDPEIGIKIVDLGLVYQVEKRPEELYIQITMTSPACPLHRVITRDIDNALRGKYPDLGPMTIELVWDPPWSPNMMSESAKKELGW